MNKTQREWFGELDREGIVGKLDELLDYCAAEVDVTHRVYKKIFPHFLETCPNTVSSAALRHLASEIVPVNKDWEANIANAEATYNKLSDGVRERLVDLTEQALEHRNEHNMYNRDPWLRQLDWSGQEVRMTKGIHDEIRYLAEEEDKYRTAMALQVADIWTRAMLSQQMGIDDLPQSCTYFSAVDLDHVLRKEVNMDCVTPSRLNAITPATRQRRAGVAGPRGLEPLESDRSAYEHRVPVLDSLRDANAIPYLRAQIATDTTEFDNVVKPFKGSPSS
ncbi:hypothetical protein B0A48_18823, partial [Cryoendolithus antarcticus]